MERDALLRGAPHGRDDGRIAIHTSERAGIEDVRVQELAKEVTDAQRREIAEMEWLIGDIVENGPATTADDAEARPVPEFQPAP